MILSGDELGRTQRGNNNSYAQDNEINWIDWEGADEDLYDFTRSMIKLRMSHPVFRRRRFFDGEPSDENEDLADIGWYDTDGSPMTHDDWVQPLNRAIAVFLNGDGLMSATKRGEPVVDDSFLILMNANSVPIRFEIPAALSDRFWRIQIDSAQPKSPDRPVVGTVEAESWSVVVLKERRNDD